MDPDMWSEAELLAEYQAALGLDRAEQIESAASSEDLVKERSKALNRLSTLRSVAPTANVKVEAWLARPVVLRLRNAGVATLKSLYQLANVYGSRPLFIGKKSGLSLEPLSALAGGARFSTLQSTR